VNESSNADENFKCISAPPPVLLKTLFETKYESLRLSDGQYYEEVTEKCICYKTVTVCEPMKRVSFSGLFFSSSCFTIVLKHKVSFRFHWHPICSIITKARIVEGLFNER